MTAITFISDIHSNYEALNLVLEEVHQHDPDELWILGDIIGNGPFPEQTVRLVRSLPEARCTVGNHDLVSPAEREFAVPKDGLAAHEWQISLLSLESKAFLGSLLDGHVYGIVKDRAIACHGVPLPGLLEAAGSGADMAHRAIKNTFSECGHTDMTPELVAGYLRKHGYAASIGGHKHEGWAYVLGPEGRRRTMRPAFAHSYGGNEFFLKEDETACIILPPAGIFKKGAADAERRPGFLMFHPEARHFEFFFAEGYSPQRAREALKREAAKVATSPEDREDFRRSIERYLARL